MDNKENSQQLSILEEYYKSVPNIQQAVTSIIENSIAIFLPFRRIDKTKIFNEFEKGIIENNERIKNAYALKNDVFEKVIIKNRLLGQIHKDILEAILSFKKKFNKSTLGFSVIFTANELSDKLKKNKGAKAYLINKLKEIKDCTIDIYGSTTAQGYVDYSFGLIQSILIKNEKYIEVSFTPDYTYFLMKNELLDYRGYIDDIMLLETDLRLIRKKLGLKKGINVDFIKAMVRYMLTHKGDKDKGSNYAIKTFINKLEYREIMTEEEIKDAITDIQRVEVKELLKDKFGISLTANNKTLTFHNKKPKYILNQSKNIFDKEIL